MNFADELRIKQKRLLEESEKPVRKPKKTKEDVLNAIVDQIDEELKYSLMNNEEATKRGRTSRDWNSTDRTYISEEFWEDVSDKKTEFYSCRPYSIDGYTNWIIEYKPFNNECKTGTFHNSYRISLTPLGSELVNLLRIRANEAGLSVSFQPYVTRIQGMKSYSQDLASFGNWERLEKDVRYHPTGYIRITYSL